MLAITLCEQCSLYRGKRHPLGLGYGSGGGGGLYHGPGVRKMLVEMEEFYRRGASERGTISFIDKIPPEDGDDTY